MDIEQRIRQYLIDNRRWHGPPEALTSDYRLIENDVLDSMSIFEMVEFIEDNYDIEVDRRDLTPDNFGSIKGIAAFVTEKTGPPSAPVA